jgi:hypothetical protein
MPRFYYSHNHIMAPAFLARQSAKLEREHRNRDSISSEIFSQHRAYVTGSISAAVSFLEGQINEVFTDAAGDRRDFIYNLGDRIFLLAEMWNLDVPRPAAYPILRKYEIALALAQKEPLHRSALNHSNAKLLISLRNALIHNEPLSSTGARRVLKRRSKDFEASSQLIHLPAARHPSFPKSSWPRLRKVGR